MKLSLIFASAIAVASVACGNSDEGNAREAPVSNEQPPGEQPPEGKTGRQLIEGKQLPTSPVNLIADPGFGLSAQQGGYGSFLAFYEGGYEQIELDTTIDSRSPASFGGAVGIVNPSGATDKKSEPVVLLTSFLGGGGPFHAQVWISKSDVKGNPVELPLDGSAVKITVADGNPDAGESFDLKPVEGSTRTAGARTWTLFKADVTKPLNGGGFFMIRTGSKGGRIHIAAPEVTSDQLVVGAPVLRTSSSFVASARTKTSIERAVINRYKSVPAKLVPAQPKVRIGQ